MSIMSICIALSDISGSQSRCNEHKSIGEAFCGSHGNCELGFLGL